MPFLNQRKGGNDRRKYFMIKSPRKNVADPAGSNPQPPDHQSDAHPTPKIPNSADTPTKLRTPAGVKLNNFTRSTFLQRYQTQPTYLPNQTLWSVLNLTTLADQHSSKDIKFSRHTYQSKHWPVLNITFLAH